MASRSLWSLCLLLALLLPLEVVLSQDFDLADALDDSKPPATPSPKPPKPAAPGTGTGGDLNLEDFFNADDTTTTTTKAPPKDVPKVPAASKAPVKPKPKPAADDFDLADALDPNNDIGVKDKNKGQGGGISDDDLLDVAKDRDYKPDKGKGGASNGGDQNYQDDNSGPPAEVGTIAGIVSAVAMALVGAVSSYISYQKKKLCFGIQQSLNADMVKAENPEAVVATEPQVQQTLLEPPNAEPPAAENTV
ncbi:CD99 antigen-like protein 2 isoform X1 [Plectropomus leopardus]|uniref:CD99 antigen-like protein 2 isoform X1 n=1 Tax=Plectropomus leopardus TaxID=160734 RepID=UPI001C4CA164|nr:CD99 antigen-like protein 2 isoform X1 [Plectropomus leopardus]